MARRLAVFACASIVVLDAAQPLLFDWVPKHEGALLGAALYLAAAVALGRGSRPFAVVVALMPIVPLSTLAAWRLGARLPVEPDAPMLVVLSVQIVAAVSAATWWWTDRPADHRRDDRTT